jgi:ATP-dependent Zn protease
MATPTMMGAGSLSTMQFSLLTELGKHFDTGNVMLNVILQTIIMSFVGYFTNQIKVILDWILRKVQVLMESSYYLPYKIIKLIKREKSKTPKTITIPFITENRKINELHDAVLWYLTNNQEIDYSKETNLQYVYDKQLSPEIENTLKTNFVINKIMKQNNSKSIKYKNYEITYLFSKEILTIYTDKEKKKENHIITLWTMIDDISTGDILEEFCKHCTLKYVESLKSSKWEQEIYVNNNKEWTARKSNNSRKLETIILKNGLRDEIKNDLELFLNSEEWYSHRDIPYTRGYLFYGYPGTGKTSMIKGMSLYCQRHIHFLMLQNVKDDNELLDLMKNIKYDKTILVIEDIDATIKAVISRDLLIKENTINKSLRNRKNKKNNNESSSEEEKKKEGITLSGLLNALDGVFNNHGRILIMTTNHPEILDDALIRPGRIDSKFKFDNCDRNQIKELFEMFFNQIAPSEQLINVKHNQYSPAHITAVFLRYRNNPNEALKHLDDIEQKIVITPLIDSAKKD